MILMRIKLGKLKHPLFLKSLDSAKQLEKLCPLAIQMCLLVLVAVGDTCSHTQYRNNTGIRRPSPFKQMLAASLLTLRTPCCQQTNKWVILKCNLFHLPV